MKKLNFASCIFGLSIAFVICNSCTRGTIDYQGAKIRIKSFERRQDHLALRLDYNTGGQDIMLKSSDFILIDKQGTTYPCAGFAAMGIALSEGEVSYVETGAVFPEISVMSAKWGTDFPLVILFENVHSIGTLKLRYRDSNFIKV
jgi:hypothetical protein